MFARGCKAKLKAIIVFKDHTHRHTELEMAVRNTLTSVLCEVRGKVSHSKNSTNLHTGNEFLSTVEN